MLFHISLSKGFRLLSKSHPYPGTIKGYKTFVAKLFLYIHEKAEALIGCI